jgi:hypothetical protein
MTLNSSVQMAAKRHKKRIGIDCLKPLPNLNLLLSFNEADGQRIACCARISDSLL